MGRADNRIGRAMPLDATVGMSLGQRVRRHVLDMIDSGAWPEGCRVPSEPQMAEQFGVSRMTVHIALRDLAAEGYLIRRQGAGSFVAPRRAQSTFLELRNIHAEIEARGGTHTTDVHEVRAVNSDLAVATELNVAPGSLVFHSLLVHREDGRPLQIEDRFVNPQFAPDYLAQDFSRITPNEHLMAIGPLEEVEHVIQATPGDARSRALLEMEEGDPILMLRRRTWSRGLIATSVRLLHPGSRFSLAGRMAMGR